MRARDRAHQKACPDLLLPNQTSNHQSASCTAGSTLPRTGLLRPKRISFVMVLAIAAVLLMSVNYFNMLCCPDPCQGNGGGRACRGLRRPRRSLSWKLSWRGPPQKAVMPRNIMALKKGQVCVLPAGKATYEREAGCQAWLVLRSFWLGLWERDRRWKGSPSRRARRRASRSSMRDLQRNGSCKTKPAQFIHWISGGVPRRSARRRLRADLQRQNSWCE